MLNAQVTWNANSSVIEPDNQLLPVLFPKGLLSNDAIGIGTQPGVGLGLHLKPSSLQNYWPIIAIERTDASQPACVKFVDNQLTGANKGWLTGMHVNTGDYSIQDVESHAIFKISSSQGSLDFNGNFQVNQAGLIHTLAGVQFPDGTIQTTASSGSNLWQQNGSQIYYNNGTVGIGTSNPLFPLHIKNQNAGIILEKNDPVNDFACVKYVDDLQNNQYWATGTVQNREKYYLWNNQHNFESAFTFTKNNQLGIGTGNPGANIHVKSASPGIFLENTTTGPTSISFSSPSSSWFTGVNDQNQYAIVGSAFNSQFAALSISAVNGNVSLGEIEPVSDHRLRITGSENNHARILFTNYNENNCQVSMGQDGANAIIDVDAPANIASCRLLLNYYHNRPIGVWGEMTCKRDVIIGGEFDNNGLLIQNTGLETLQENRTDNINAIGLKISHSGTDRFVVKGDGSLNIMPYDIQGAVISVKAPNSTNNVFSVYDDGKLFAKEIKVASNDPWADYVFEKDYNLMPLSELKSYIFKNKHLPNMPSATEVKTEGINMEKTLNKQQEKIEELTLYILQLEERLKALEGNGGGK